VHYQSQIKLILHPYADGMRLINAKTLELEQFFDEKIRPEYAILSHTWGSDEVTFDDMSHSRRRKKKQGFQKILYTCKQAIEDGCGYAWVDT
jgi:hypothetical protein